MSTRSHRVSALVLGLVALAGCSDSFNAGPIHYVPSEKVVADLAEKPQLRQAVEGVISDLYGPNPREMKVPDGMPLPDGGRHLANYIIDLSDGSTQTTPVKAVYAEPGAEGKKVWAPGGYALYRKHCLHCHGVSGDGNGPTAPFLFPKPRDFRPGIFKFTSTTSEKPTRQDLRRTIRLGLNNTAMPSFEALMTADEIEQVIDYLMFLSMRGETERQLVEEATFEEETFLNDKEGARDLGLAVAQQVFEKWRPTDEGGRIEVVQPPVPRTPTSPESVQRGRTLFLGQKGLQCSGCHGAQARGDGPSWVDPETFNRYVFGMGIGPERFLELKEYSEPKNLKWGDDWGTPLRPANLNLGVYKGGRRPIDLYWRIATGIKGAQMPAHNTQLTPEEIWDVVNFVLALPFEPDLLKGAVPVQPEAAPAVARR